VGNFNKRAHFRQALVVKRIARGENTVAG